MISPREACGCSLPATAPTPIALVDHPGSNDWTRSASDGPAHSFCTERYGEVDRRGFVAHQEGTCRTGPRHQRAQSAVLEAGLQHGTQPRLQVQRSRLQIVAERPSKELRIAAAQSIHQTGGHVGRWCVGAQLIESAINRGRGQPVKAKGKHPVVGTSGERGRHVLPPPTAYGGATKQCKGHIAAELRSKCPHPVGGDVEVPEDRARKAAAPFAEPPANPPATGMDFLIDRLAPREWFGP